TVRLATARNAAVAEAARTQRIQRFMLNLFQGGDEAVGPADSLRVVTLVDRGVQDARSLDAEPAVQAELYETLGSIYQKLGMRDLANTHFYAGHLAVADSLDRLVLAMTRTLNGERHPLVAEDLINLGAVQQEWGHYKEAEQYYRQALDITQAFYGPNHYKTAAGLTVLGRALRFEPQGNDEAARLFEQALVIRERVFGKVHPQV